MEEMIQMPVSELTVSAGTGQFLSEENITMASFPASQVPKLADFALRVSGNSMEPVYHNGQLIWVQKTNHLRSGEVGIFVYDGCGYVKEYSEQMPKDPEPYLDSRGVLNLQPVLISYNKAYPPMPVSPETSFLIVGRVLEQ